MAEPKNICVGVTGAAGFTGSHVVLKLLQEGYTVNCTVRNIKDERVEALKKFEGAEERMNVFEADLFKEGSFSKAFAGCKYVIHVATSVKLASENAEEEILKPAVNGTLNVMDSCVRSGVEKFVLTSSMAAIAGKPRGKHGIPYNEKDWNSESSLKSDPYPYSKTQAEKAAWKFVEECKEKYDGKVLRMTSINPGYIIGPVLMNNGPSGLQVFSRFLNGAIPMVPALNFKYVDVRDVVEGMVKAMVDPDTDNERYLLAGESVWMQDVAKIINNKFPQYKVSTMRCPNFLVYTATLFDKDVPFSFMWNHLGVEANLDNTKSKEKLNITYRSIESSVVETCESLIEQGVVQKKNP